MTNQTLPTGVSVMPGAEQLNEALRPAGLGAKIYIANRTAGLFFGRRQPKDATPEQLTDWRAALNIGEAAAADILGSGTVFGGQPNVTGIGYTDRPQDIPFGDLVQPVLGAGFFGSNPHKACLALVAGPSKCRQHGIITSFADAPPQKYVYADLDDPHNPVVITIDGQILWNRIPAPQDDELDSMRANLVGRIAKELETTVTGYGMQYDPNNLWSFTGPAANDVYHVGRTSKYGQLIAGRDWNKFVTTKTVPAGLVGNNVGFAVGDGVREITSLRLRDWAHHLATEVVGVPAEQAFVLEHDTVTDDRYASARLGARSGNAMLSLIHEVAK